MFSGSREPYTACLGAITELLHVTALTQLKPSQMCMVEIQAAAKEKMVLV